VAEELGWRFRNQDGDRESNKMVEKPREVAQKPGQAFEDPRKSIAAPEARFQIQERL